SQDYIVAHDGSTYTLILSEDDNVTANSTGMTSAWTGQFWAPTAITGYTGTSTTNAASLPGVVKYGTIFQWSGIQTAAAMSTPVQQTAPSGFNRINGSKGQTGAQSSAYARPASNHPGGVVVAFCDGHVRFIAEDIPYYVYKQLMSPYGVGTADTDQGL